MTHVFETVLNISIDSLWLIFAVLCARFMLCQAPKWTRMILWLLVAVRLVLPFTPESPLSLVPETAHIELSAEGEDKAEETPEGQSSLTRQGEQDTGEQTPVTQSPITPSVPEEPEVDVTPVTPEAPAIPDTPEKEGTSVITEDDGEGLATAAEQTDSEEISVMGNVLSAVWVVGMALIACYFVFNYIRLRLRLRDAVHTEGRLWHSDRIDSAFVFGFIKPRVYMPFRIDEASAAYVLAHEQAHIKRGDHIIKPLAFLIFALHWFNPAVWIAYVLFCKDVELACDEAVVRGMNAEKKNEYSHALVSLSTEKHGLSVYPINFGEVGIKARVKSILNYKKPAFWIVVGAVAVCVIVAVCFMTVRSDESASDPTDSAESSETTESTESTESTDGTDATEETTAGTESTDVTESTEHTESPEPVFMEPEYNYVPTDYYPIGDAIELKTAFSIIRHVDFGSPSGITTTVAKCSEPRESYRECTVGFDFIYTFEELQNALDEVEPDYKGEHPLKDLYQYDESFFEDGVLVATYRSFSSGAQRYSFEGVYKMGAELCFFMKTDVYRSTGGLGYPGVVEMSLQVHELERSVLDGIDTVSLYAEDMYPYYLPKTPEHYTFDTVSVTEKPEGTDVSFKVAYQEYSDVPMEFMEYEGMMVHLVGSEYLDTTECLYDYHIGEAASLEQLDYEQWLRDYLAADRGHISEEKDGHPLMHNSVINGYDEEYFEEKAVILIYRRFYYGPLEYSVKSVVKNGTELGIIIESEPTLSDNSSYPDEVKSSAISVVEFSKADLKDVETVKLYTSIEEKLYLTTRNFVDCRDLNSARSIERPSGSSLGFKVYPTIDYIDVGDELPAWDHLLSMDGVDGRVSMAFYICDSYDEFENDVIFKLDPVYSQELLCFDETFFSENALLIWGYSISGSDNDIAGTALMTDIVMEGNTLGVCIDFTPDESVWDDDPMCVPISIKKSDIVKNLGDSYRIEKLSIFIE